MDSTVRDNRDTVQCAKDVSISGAPFHIAGSDKRLGLYFIGHEGSLT